MDFQSLVERKLSPTGVSGNDIIYPCPICEDSADGHHLYVNYDKGYFHCFHCNFGGKRVEGLLKKLNVNIDYDYDKLYTEKDKALDDIITPKKKVSEKLVDYSTDLEILTRFYHWQVKPLSIQAYEYLRQRGLNDDMMIKLGIVEGVNRYGDAITVKGKEVKGRDYSGRILVPSLRKDGLISFYVARDYIGDKDAKYVNPPSELAVASEDVWNLDMVDSDSVIICEGVFSAIFASPYKLNSVATYGKSVAQKSSNSSEVRVTSQGEKLLAKKFKNYYIAYDADAHSEAIATCEYLHDRGANVYLVLIDPKKYGPKADTADIGYQEFLKLMMQAIPYNDLARIGLTLDF